ncbi:MAG: FecR domain-containing protein [Candidatus Omnitrophica bacterium]|jgi:hypothetical protein|nr:FecR domain-containing protein [Candidatus Omnitrophota bacterium]
MSKLIVLLIIIAVIAAAAGGVYFYYQKGQVLAAGKASQKNEAFYVSGYVSHKKGREGQWSALTLDTRISDGDYLKTAKGSAVDIKFGKDMKNIISASEDTSLGIKKIELSGDKGINLEQGKLISDLKGLDPGSKFEIKTPTAVCGVLGTGFETIAKDDQTILKVYEGRVYVKGAGMQSVIGKEIVVSEGNQTVIYKSRAPEQPTPLNEDDRQKWREWKDELIYKMFRPFYVFFDENDPKNHYHPSGWLGDYDAIRRLSWEENPHSGKDCLRFRYTGKTPQGAGWAGVYWQNPVNNWGDVQGGYDLSGAKRLSFWARGEKGGETIVRFGVGGITGQYPDSVKAEIGPVVLSNTWREYQIDLTGKDLTCVSGGFYWMTDRNSNPDGAVIYLDNIVYE